MSAYYLGIDGGGSKTGGALVDASGAVLATCQAGPSSIVGAPDPGSCATLLSVMTRLCVDAGICQEEITGIGIGLSGIDFSDEIPLQHATLACMLSLPPERLLLVNDGIAALWGATSVPAAVILQHGTGFTAAYRNGYGNECLFDHLNVGHCYDLRAEALALVARMIDGRAAVTSLKDRLLACLGQPADSHFAEIVYRCQITPAQAKGLLQAVFAAGEAGDSAAVKLITRAADDYVCTVDAMIRKAGHTAPEVVFGGGRFLAAPRSFWRRLTEAIERNWPGAVIKRPELSPAVGAAIMAAYADGCPPVRFFKKGHSEISCG